ncbi:MAG: four helix bundle protein [Candidatus Kerfeldbacteria bacterium CG08_land_8_20_14_0_20_40_16]|uniref:Four helix bundle protein n=1 Tax=Candidatus Kerfeldbacteria bacterium CG08_land_8_20_14_0_20_40_16 TaxID=2014244 RepID=A0A2H0YWV7_9BACT|nr:MAG: four helix bundle protein [Candidatus Kerfeldbacteria bacterium CG08_land_8_20_14_0_20_40_16]
MPNSFQDLNIWKKGYDLLKKVYQLTEKYPKDEKYLLVQDTRRSANSIIANIAESHGRYFFADKIRVLYIARGEAEETRSHLKVAEGLHYVTEEEFLNIDKEYEWLTMGISKYINYLSQNKKPPIH